jgi:thymidylate synthase ThyX
MMVPRLPRRELPDPYKVEIVLDSLAPSGSRLTTFALTYPRFVHAELLTHRIFSRNSASSRAIPSEKMRDLVKNHPALPIWWGKNQAGMQAREELDDKIPYWEQHSYVGPGETRRAAAKRLWLEARDVMIKYSDMLADLVDGEGLHKQLCNRLTEPWMPITVLVSSTSYGNWFHLRDHKDAQPELQVIATEMHYQYLESKPQLLQAGEWHLPYIRAAATIGPDGIGPNDYELADVMCSMEHGATNTEVLKKVSVGRCARVSYLTHEGVRDLVKDVELHDKLAATASSEDPGHFSPFEHVAMALGEPVRIGNFVGWHQYRKNFANEAGPA